MYNCLTLFAKFVPLSLYLYVSSIPLFNRLNFLGLWEQVLFYLSVMDLDLALQVEKLFAIIDKSNAKEKALYKAWERSNRLSLMFT